MVTHYTHELLNQSALFCSEISYSDIQMYVHEEMQVDLIYLIICLQKLK